MLPIIARAADVVLRVVPGGLREASLALGASRWRTVWHVVLPTARPGLATAVILGVARGVGETSPVLLTSGAAAFMVTNPTDGVMNSLPLFIYSACAAVSRAIARAFARRHRPARPRAGPLRHRPPARATAHQAPPSPRRSDVHGRRLHRSRPSSRRRRSPLLVALADLRCSRAPRPRPASDGLRPDRGHRLHLVGADRPAVDRRRRRQRHEGRLHRRRLDQGPQGLLPGQHRLRDLRDPLPGHRRAGPGRHQQRPRVRLPADRRRRHGVHLPAQDRRQAGPQPAALGRDDRQDLHQPDHQLERPGDHQGQQRPQVPVAADHPGRPLRRLGHDGAVHDLDGQRVPDIWRPFFGQSGPDVVLPAKGRADGARPAPTR